VTTAEPAVAGEQAEPDVAGEQTEPAVAGEQTDGRDTAPALDIAVEQAETVDFAAVPTLKFRARIDSAGGEPIRFIALATQIRIAARSRQYGDGERDRLLDLFGAPEEWSRSLRSLLWTHTTTQVPGFTGSTVAEILVPCTYDFEVVAARYLHALADGDVPLEFLFSGSIFYSSGGLLRVAQIPWHVESAYRMPVEVWQRLMERYFPRSAWLRLDRDTFDRLRRYQARNTLATWSDAVERLLREAGRPAGGA
jgi:hypothetical protein